MVVVEFMGLCGGVCSYSDDSFALRGSWVLYVGSRLASGSVL